MYSTESALGIPDGARISRLLTMGTSQARHCDIEFDYTGLQLLVIDPDFSAASVARQFWTFTEIFDWFVLSRSTFSA